MSTEKRTERNGETSGARIGGVWGEKAVPISAGNHMNEFLSAGWMRSQIFYGVSVAHGPMEALERG